MFRFPIYALHLAAASLVAAASPGASPAPGIAADQAKILAVNTVTTEGTTLVVSHPRRRVELAPEGLRMVGRRGAPEWRWRLEAIESAQGRSVVATRAVAPFVVEPGRIRYDRGPVQEDYLLGLDSFEQRFVIAEPLPLEGEDLVVVGSVACDGELEELDDGWRWHDERGEATLGRVTVVDAAGVTLPSRFLVDRSSTRIVVDGASLAGAAYPVVIDPEIGTNDRRISDMGPDGDPSYDGIDAAVAYNSIEDQYLVVWSGDDTPGGLVDDEFEIFGQVLSASGSELGYNDVRISFAGGTGSSSARAFSPAVAFNETYNEFLVVWMADNPEDGCVDGEFEIWGQVVDPYLFPKFGANFRVSFNGGSGSNAYHADRPSVAYNPHLDDYLVVWEGDHDSLGMVNDESEIWAQRVKSTGSLVGDNLRISDMGGSGDPDFGAFAPDVVYNPLESEYLIVWYGDDNTGGLVDQEFEIFGQLITETGTGVGNNDYRLSDLGGTGNASYGGITPAVAYNSRANEYLVVWMGDDTEGGLVNDELEVFSQRLDADLGGLGANDYRISDAGGIGDLTFSVTWGPDVAYNPRLDQYLVVWSGGDTVDGMVVGEKEVFAQLLDAEVGGLGPNDERISDAGGLGSASYVTRTPAVAANRHGTGFLVAWGGDDDVGLLAMGENEIFVQQMDGVYLFVDGFESGDATAWSAASP